MRVPLARPRGVGLAASAQAAGAAASLAVSLAWLGAGSVLAGIAAAVLLALAWLAIRPGRGGASVGALAAQADSPAWRVLTGQGWQAATLRRAELRGGRLFLRLAASAGADFRITVWRATLRPQTWRRLCFMTAGSRAAGGAA